MNTKGLGKKQKSILASLAEKDNRFINVIHDHRDMSVRITLSDDNLNDYCFLSQKLFETLVDRKIIEYTGEHGSLEVVVQKFVLTDTYKFVKPSARP